MDSPINATRVRLNPVACYTAAEGVDGVTDNQGNFVLQVLPTYDMDLYPGNAPTAQQGLYTVTASGISPVEGKSRVEGLVAGERTSAVFTAKHCGALLAKQVLDLAGVDSPLETTFTVNSRSRLAMKSSSM